MSNLTPPTDVWYWDSLINPDGTYSTVLGYVSEYGTEGQPDYQCRPWPWIRLPGGLVIPGTWIREIVNGGEDEPGSGTNLVLVYLHGGVTLSVCGVSPDADIDLFNANLANTPPDSSMFVEVREFKRQCERWFVDNVDGRYIEIDDEIANVDDVLKCIEAGQRMRKAIERLKDILDAENQHLAVVDSEPIEIYCACLSVVAQCGLEKKDARLYQLICGEADILRHDAQSSSQLCQVTQAAGAWAIVQCCALAGREKSQSQNLKAYELCLNFSLNAHAFVEGTGEGDWHCVARKLESTISRVQLLGDLGKEDSKDLRQLIVCETSSRSWEGFAWDYPDGVLVTVAGDIEAYNKNCAPEDRLIFQMGHPRDGLTYVQHPCAPNRYFELSSYNESVFERKKDELIRLLEALGAVSAEVVAEATYHGEASDSAVTSRGGGIEYQTLRLGFGASGNKNDSNSTSYGQSVSRKQGEKITFRPTGKPHLPDTLEFFPYETTWQRLAESALQGRVEETTIDLEYRQDSTISENRINEWDAKIQVMIPSFSFNGKNDFAHSAAEMASIVWHYSVKFAPMKKDVPVIADNGGNGRSEGVFVKRTMRYLRQSGKLDTEARNELNEFATRLGIDDLRMEELIEEAFGQLGI